SEAFSLCDFQIDAVGNPAEFTRGVVKFVIQKFFWMQIDEERTRRVLPRLEVVSGPGANTSPEFVNSAECFCQIEKRARMRYLRAPRSHQRFVRESGLRRPTNDWLVMNVELIECIGEPLLGFIDRRKEGYRRPMACRRPRDSIQNLLRLKRLR